MDRSFVPSIVPSGHDQTVYLVINNFRNLGTAFLETDIENTGFETIIGDLMSGQYSDPVRVAAFNTAEHWAEDASVDVAREILRRLDLAGHELPSSIQAFVDGHLGPVVVPGWKRADHAPRRRALHHQVAEGRARYRTMAGRDAGAIARRRTRRACDVRPHRRDESIEPSRRVGVQSVAQGSSLGKTEIETRRDTKFKMPQNSQRRLAEYDR
jgi:hypothetical protein